MPAERAGYTVTMFLVDISPSMGKIREVDVSDGRSGETRPVEMTNLEWSIQYVMLKIQEMIYNGRKTEQCGVILLGTEDTDNVVNEKSGGYEHITEYIPIGQPNAGTLAKLAALQPSTTSGDPIDAIIVGVEIQDRYLASKKTWTRKMVLLTDGESPMEVEDWEGVARKINTLGVSFNVIGVDFDDDDAPFHEENKNDIKRENEAFYRNLVSQLNNSYVGNCDLALHETARPDIHQARSAMLGTVLRIGDTDARLEEAIEISVKTSKCTALQRPKSWKKFAKREDDEAIRGDDEAVFAQLRMRTEYGIDKDDGAEDDSLEGEDEDDEDKQEKKEPESQLKVEKEQLVRGFKYGASYVPCPDGQFAKLTTRKGIDICGLFKDKLFRREYSTGDVTYIWADPAQPMQQVALSSLVQAMYEKGAMAIARWVGRDFASPKMGVLRPMMFQDADCFLWVQMPFADDVRNFPFASLEKLVSKKGEIITKHPYLPTDEQMEAMESFVDAMDLMDAGEKDEDGVRQPWFDTRMSYNPAVHRTKQALFHSAIVRDLSTHPVPPPHPELLKYFEPPRRVLKRAHSAVEECKQAFKIKEVPKKVARIRKDGHVRARDEDEEMILLDKMPNRMKSKSQSQSQSQLASMSQVKVSSQSQSTDTKPRKVENDSETEPESDEDDILLNRKNGALPTPARTLSPGDEDKVPGRIIGNAHPLQDFRDNIVRGDVVTKAVEDLAAVIKEVAILPFAARRTDELLECMQELRKTALEEDEIDAWNEFIRDMRAVCIEEEPGNEALWERAKGVGRKISLISNSEARSLGGKSDIPEDEAVEFIRQ